MNAFDARGIREIEAPSTKRYRQSAACLDDLDTVQRIRNAANQFRATYDRIIAEDPFNNNRALAEIKRDLPGTLNEIDRMLDDADEQLEADDREVS